MTLGVRRSLSLDVGELATLSRATLTCPIEGEAELWLARPAGDAVLGADGLVGLRDVDPAGVPRVRVGAGSLWIALLLPRPDALVPCDETRVVNRYVRPLLRALTKSGALAHYFGRDWISVGHRPVAWVWSAHDPGGRTTFEAVVAVATPFDAEPHPSFLGKQPGTLESIVGKPFDVAKVADAVVASYSDAYGRAAVDLGALPDRAQNRA